MTETNESSTRPVVTFKRGADGKWYFNVRAANGEIVAQSEGYERLPSAMHGYDALRALVAGAPLTNLNSFTVDNNDGS